MKNILLTVLLLSSMLASAQQKKFEIRAKLNGWKQKEQVMLTYTLNEKVIFDTTDVVGGKFSFKGQLQQPVSATIVLISGKGKGARDNRTFFIDKGLVQLEGSDSLKRSKVSGSKLTMEGEELQTQVNPLLERFVAVRIKGMSMTKEKKDSPELKALEKEFGFLVKSITDTRKAFINKYPGSFVSLVTVKSMIGNPINYNSIAPVYALLSPEMKASSLGQQIGKDLEIAKKTNIGAIMPDFMSLDTLRKPLSLYEVVKKGKVTLVDFWASWCKPCREENPNVVKAFNAFHEKGFNIISVSLDQNAASWKKAIKVDGMPWYHVSGLKYWDEPVALQFGITGVPDNFLLDGEGKILARGLRGEALYLKIRELIHGETLEQEIARKAKIQEYIKARDSVEAALKREPSAAGKEKIVKDFFGGPIGKLSFFSLSKQIMESDLAIAYAAENNVKASDAYLNAITSSYTKADIGRKVAIAYSKAGNTSLAVQMLKPILDSLLLADGTIKNAGRAQYTYTAQAYMEVLKPGSEKEVYHYLKPLYEAGGKFFSSDVSATADSDIRKKLFYRYAKALPAATASKEIAEVLSTAFQNGIVPVKLQDAVMKDFSNVPNLRENIANNSKIGKQLFDDSVKKLFAKTDINGKIWGADAFKGKYVLIDFWGSWCIPCRGSHPHLKEVYNKYKDKGFEIVGVAMESATDLEKAKLTWKKAVKDDGIDWIQVLVNDGIESFDPVKAFGIGMFPTKILLNKDGTELARYSGTSSEQFDQKMKEIFKF